jgi:hypothetical protein
MTKIFYEQGTFTYALMLGVLTMPAAYAMPGNGELALVGKPVLCCVNYSDENSPTFDKYSNFTSDPFTRFLLKQEPQQQADLIFIAKPRTELGRKLLEYRKAALAKGVRMLSADEIDVMVNEGRGSFA